MYELRLGVWESGSLEVWKSGNLGVIRSKWQIQEYRAYIGIILVPVPRPTGESVVAALRCHDLLFLMTWATLVYLTYMYVHIVGTGTVPTVPNLRYLHTAP